MLDIRLFKTIQDITGQSPRDVDQAKAALLHHLKGSEAEPFIVDENDLSLLIDLCAIFTKKSINQEVIALVKDESNLAMSDRQKLIKPSKNEEDRKLCSAFITEIQKVYPMLKCNINNHNGISMRNLHTNKVVVDFDSIATIFMKKDVFNGRITVYHITTQAELEQIIPIRYRNNPISFKWTFHQAQKGSAHRIFGKYFTLHQLIDILKHPYFTGDGDTELYTGQVVD